MPDFDDDPFAAMAQESAERRMKKLSVEPQQQSRAPRARRASIATGGPATISRTRSSERLAGAQSVTRAKSGDGLTRQPSSRRVAAGGSSVRSLDGVLSTSGDDPPSNSRSTRGERSVVSAGSVRRAGHRASLAAAPSSRQHRADEEVGHNDEQRSNMRVSRRHSNDNLNFRDNQHHQHGKEESVDYGYVDGCSNSPSMLQEPGDGFDDQGYGETSTEAASPQPRQNRPSHRQRRCSIADVQMTSMEHVNLSSYNSDLQQNTQQTRQLGATPSTSSVANFAIPMANDLPKPQRSNRRGSLIGGLGFTSNKIKDKAEVQPEANKTQDRDRRRQGTLLDRVGGTDSAAAVPKRRTPGSERSSYSDRVMTR